ncbi:Acid sphingomyelinase-like phosphodiesterase 3b [Porphyridium purpureum]|uniref:Acid sphingomyelinase-like phosphodiesterase 3b n=1 Tax=Porphyridium purpureum TaxID=35688 RepID=A0A5J4YKH3_PORPP|nr:Acid sphingomyelinase-like phosphodiesterase 3b [Porphyridium purpureum]|eukprot:POR5448..scf291_13
MCVGEGGTMRMPMERTLLLPQARREENAAAQEQREPDGVREAAAACFCTPLAVYAIFATVVLFASNAWRLAQAEPGVQWCVCGTHRACVDNGPTRAAHLQRIQELLKFWWVSDLHIDLDYSAHVVPETPWLVCREFDQQRHTRSSGRGPGHQAFALGRVNCDPPLALFESQLLAMHAEDPNPSAIFLTGDVIAHFIASRSRAAQTLREVAAAISRKFPSTRVFVALGNVDMQLAGDESDDSALPLQFEFLASIFHSVGWLHTRDMQHTFATGGYYKADLDASLSVISINTNLMLKRQQADAGSNRAQLARQMLLWIEHQALRAQLEGRRLLLLGHAAPGAKTQLANWYEEYTTQFSDLSARFRGVFIMHLFGDFTEAVELRMLWDNSSQDAHVSSGVLIHPGLTPRRPAAPGSNPSFKQILYSRDQRVIMDSITWVMNLQAASFASMTGAGPHLDTWERQPSIRERFGLASLHSDELEALFMQLRSNVSTLERFYRVAWSRFITNHDFTSDLCDMRFTAAGPRLKCYADPTGLFRGLSESQAEPKR